MQVGIVTDSTCDLPTASLLRLGVASVPLKLKLGDEVYRDWRDINPTTVYQQMLEHKHMPVITAPDAADFIPVYRRYLSAYKHIVSIHIASSFSNTLEHAQEAASHLGVEDRVHFVDSGTTSAALAEMVIAAANEAAAGLSVEDVLWFVHRMRESMYLLACPASLEWLYQHGQLSTTMGKVAEILNLRPLYSLEQGTLRSEGQVRQQAMLHKLAQRVYQRFDQEALHITLFSTDSNEATVNGLKRATEEVGLNILQGRVQQLGITLGAQLGPGTLGLCACPKIYSLSGLVD